MDTPVIELPTRKLAIAFLFIHDPEPELDQNRDRVDPQDLELQRGLIAMLPGNWEYFFKAVYDYDAGLNILTETNTEGDLTERIWRVIETQYAHHRQCQDPALITVLSIMPAYVGYVADITDRLPLDFAAITKRYLSLPELDLPNPTFHVLFSQLHDRFHAQRALYTHPDNINPRLFSPYHAETQTRYVDQTNPAIQGSIRGMPAKSS